MTNKQKTTKVAKVVKELNLARAEMLTVKQLDEIATRANVAVFEVMMYFRCGTIF